MNLKKALSLCICACLLVVTGQCLVPTAAISKANAADPTDANGTKVVGEFIACTGVSPAEASPLIDNSGMSGLRAPNHLHDSDLANSYYASPIGSNVVLTFTLPQIEALGYMYIWNYNGDDTRRGMKEVKIEYSVDNENWQTLGDTFRLAQALDSENTAYGGNGANNLDDGRNSPIDFGGVPARYVRITSLSNYGGRGYGLSEVRFFRYKTRPCEGSALAITATAPVIGAENVNVLTSGYGLSDLYSANATHGNDPATMWYAAPENPADGKILLKLDGNYPLEKLLIWNYNESAHTDRGMKEIKLEYTIKSPCSIVNGATDYNGGDWIEVGTYTVPEATGENDLLAGLTVELKNLHAQYLRITPVSNYGGDGYGLSAVRLFAGSGWGVEPSREWTGLFSSEGTFPYQLSGQNPREGYGWLAADGIYSIHMNGADQIGSATKDSKTVFLFSDTQLGNFMNFSGEFGKYGNNMFTPDMRNHTMATLIGNEPDPRNLQFYMHAGSGYGNIFSRQAWAQELVRIGDKLYSWAMRYEGWSPTQYDMVQFDITDEGFPDFSKAPTVTDAFPIRVVDGIYTYEFSAGLLDNTASGGASPDPDGYIYIYGMKSWNDGFWLHKAPVVARVKAEEYTDRAAWRFWNGSDWDAEIKNVANLNQNNADVSSEYSVSYIADGLFAGKYMMTYTKDTMFGELCFRLADTPYGPFGDPTTLYYSPETFEVLDSSGVSDIYTYNGKAHPHLSKEGELLMTYNVNSQSFKTAMEFLHPSFVNLFTLQPAETVLPGDVDESGKVDVADIMKLKSLIMADAWEDKQLSIGDLNNSGKLDVADIMAVKNIIMSGV